MRHLWNAMIAGAAAALLLAAAPSARDPMPQTAASKPAQRLAIYVPTPMDVALRMLQIADVTRRDVVYDLGCGDGRLVVLAASKFGARGVGVDVEPWLIDRARERARAAGVARLATFRVEDALTTDVSAATVVTLYLGNSSNLQLRPALTAQLRPGARVVSHQFGMGDWTPLRTEAFKSTAGYTRMIYLWKADGVVR